jgi:hypothetical protein
MGNGFNAKAQRHKAPSTKLQRNPKHHLTTKHTNYTNRDGFNAETQRGRKEMARKCMARRCATRTGQCPTRTGFVNQNSLLHFFIVPLESAAKMRCLKRLLPHATAALLLLVSSHRLQAQQWYFEDTSPLITGSGTSLSGIAPEFGSGTASAFHASPLTVWSSPVGNGSSHSFSADHWAVGDYWQFQISTIGLAPDFITYDQTRSSTGPAQFKLSYSTDGVNFTSFPSSSPIVRPPIIPAPGTARRRGVPPVTKPFSPVQISPAQSRRYRMPKPFISVSCVTRIHPVLRARLDWTISISSLMRFPNLQRFPCSPLPVCSSAGFEPGAGD